MLFRVSLENINQWINQWTVYGPISLQRAFNWMCMQCKHLLVGWVGKVNKKDLRHQACWVNTFPAFAARRWWKMYDTSPTKRTVDLILFLMRILSCMSYLIRVLLNPALYSLQSNFSCRLVGKTLEETQGEKTSVSVPFVSDMRLHE